MASPKSHTTGVQRPSGLRSRRMLEGLRSRWIRFRRWAAWMASATWARITTTSFTVSSCATSDRVGPRTSCMAILGIPPELSTS